LSELARALVRPPSARTRATAEAAVARVAALASVSDGPVFQSTRSLLIEGDAGAGLERPVAGRLLRGFREPDAAGVAQPGLTFAAAPRSVVLAPAAGDVRFVGAFLDYNQVVVIAPDDGGAILLAGMAEALVAPGARVAPGEPLGLLGGRAVDAQEFLMLPSGGSAPLGEETLYMEVRRAGEPLDPTPMMAGMSAGNG
jgi:septal ring factor EnvC (AmiA/AmiB activator)